MATTTTKIGFVGLGHMGGTVAAGFRAAGYTVYGESRERGHADKLVHEGLQWRDAPRERAEPSHVGSRRFPTTTYSKAWRRGTIGYSPASPSRRSGST